MFLIQIYYYMLYLCSKFKIIIICYIFLILSCYFKLKLTEYVFFRYPANVCFGTQRF